MVWVFLGWVCSSFSFNNIIDANCSVSWRVINIILGNGARKVKYRHTSAVLFLLWIVIVAASPAQLTHTAVLIYLAKWSNSIDKTKE